MDISSLGNYSTAIKSGENDSGKNNGLNSNVTTQEVSPESQASLLPPPSAAEQAESGEAEVPNPKEDTGNLLNVIA